MLFPKTSVLAASLSLFGAMPLFAADAADATAPVPAAAAPAAAPAVDAPAPAPATAPAIDPNAPARGGRRGGGRGGRGGGPMTADEQAAIAKLALLPPWTPGAGVGDYSLPQPYATPSANTADDKVPKGKVVTFELPLADSKFYPGTGPNSGRQSKPTRKVVVYIPAQYVPGTPAPVIVTHDAMGANDNPPSPSLPIILDNLIAAKRVPAMVAVMVGSGGGDGPGSERGLEYDTVSGKYAEFIEAEVLPRVAKDYNVTFSKDPDARATLGGSSGGAVAFSMAWFHPELYHRVLVYSGTFVNQQAGPDAPHGAWEFHENFIPKTNPAKPLRVWMEVGQNDNGATGSGAGFHNWVLANLGMAKAMKEKGYAYQLVYAMGAKHVDGPARAATLAPALEWLWKDYKPATK